MIVACSLCEKNTDSLSHIAEQWLIDKIRADHPDWIANDGACPKCIEYYEKLDKEIEVVKQAE